MRKDTPTMPKANPKAARTPVGISEVATLPDASPVAAEIAELAATPAPPASPAKAKLVLVKPEYTVNDVILSVAPNPKRPGTEAYYNYAQYRVGMSVLEYLTRSGIARSQASTCLRFDLARRYITVGEAKVVQVD